MKEKLEKIKEDTLNELTQIHNLQELLNIKAKYLGKKSLLTELMSSLKDMSIEAKKEFGSLLNLIKKELEEAFEKKQKNLTPLSQINFDDSLPVQEELGSLHPVTIVGKSVCDIFKRMGFTVINYDEMESEYYNFEALNIPKNHPARDMQDTYWLSNGLLLRTHTSTNQVKTMEKYGAPLRVIAPGRCFRNEDMDASHENTFFQLEGMVIDKELSIGNLIYVMQNMLQEVFKKDVKVRLRPGFFPFVEPGFELDINCLICDGIGCPTCKGSGWLELCPCGMIHPNVLKAGGIDTEIYNGFAFGLGLTRLAMMKYKVKDIRLFNTGDVRFLKQFNIN